MDSSKERQPTKTGQPDDAGREEVDAPQRRTPRVHRERDYGIGYGNSSGYGYDRHFLDGHVDPLFRCR